MKSARQEKILEIIEKHNIETQEELLEKLKEADFFVTQATISRDIRELKLLKGMTASGGYKYVVAGKSDFVLPKFNSALTESITKVDHASNLLVVKTYAGMAQAVATCIDSLPVEEIIGCVAGDDAILVVVNTPEAAAELCDKLRTLIRTL
ncbi:MAG: arginine repressor [Eubacteriales bacterium]